MTQKAPHRTPEHSRAAHRANATAAAVREPAHPALRLQRALGNHALVQARLQVTRPDDPFEREAEQVAMQVMRMPAPRLQRRQQEDELLQTKPASPPSLARQADEEEETLQAKRIRPTSATAQRRAETDEKLQPRYRGGAASALAMRQVDEEEPLQRREADSTTSAEIDQAIEAKIHGMRGGGRELPPSSRRFFEQRFGHDFSGVRVHTGSEAATVARSLRAEAFTVGSDIFFGDARYSPDTSAGRTLLAHELTHTIQQQASPPLAARQPANPGSPPAPEDAAPVLPTVSLAGGTFEPPAEVAEAIETADSRVADIPVAFGRLASGILKIRKSGNGYATPGEKHHPVPLLHPALEPLRRAGLEPVLAVRIRRNAITGYVTIASDRRPVGNPADLLEWIKKHSEEMGWIGIDVTRFPEPENKLENGTLRLQVKNFPFKLGGFLDGQGNFGLVNETVTFDAKANIRVPGLTESQLEIHRDEQGTIRGRAEVPVRFERFSGNVIANYQNGVVDIRGTVRYEDEKFSGEITLLVTDAATARNVALEHLGPEAVNQAAEASNGARERGRRGRRPRPDERALAGWGELDFAFTEWLTGKAMVIVDNEGHITVIGEITPQAEIELFPQKDYIYRIFKFEIRAAYGVPVVGNVFLFANIGMEALAKLGPGKIYNIAVRGRYSTDPRVFNEFSIEGTLNISAFAGLRLRAEGGAGVELLGHDIKAGIGLNALAGIRGYVEATPVIGYREKAAPEEGKEGEFYFKGHMELAAQPFLGLSGDLFVELDSPWWSPAPDKKWTWPVGELEYPLPGEFGIGADVDYVIGSGEVPEVQFGEVDFNSEKFMTDLLSDHVPPKSHGEQEKQGEWQEAQTTGETPEPALADTEGAPPPEPARGRQAPGEGEPPRPEIQQRWLEGMAALGRLAERSREDPLTRRELEAKLAQIKRRYHFRALRIESSGEDWAVYPSMSPEPPEPVRIEGEPDEAEGGENGAPQADAPTGKTRTDPIEMIWYKPPGLYPQRIELGGESYFFTEPDVLRVPDSAGLADVRREAFAATDEIEIGVASSGENFPRVGRIWPRVRSSVVRTGARQRNFRNLLAAYGYDWGTQEADHVRDLQWAGKDAYDNLWPLERRWNNAANQILRQEVTYKDDAGNVVTVPLQRTPLNRYFIIRAMQQPA